MTDTSERAPVEIRSAPITAVNFPERLIELVAVPYDVWATVEYPTNSGRLIEESFEPGAFGNIQNRAHRFIVNLEHELDRKIGIVRALHPGRSEGLVAELNIRRGPEGDQTLLDAEDGMIGGSVGFACLPKNQRWEGRSRRRIMTAFVDHIALTFTPAYPGTMPIAVRSAPAPVAPGERAPTPHLDRIMVQRLADEYPAL
jgi:phage head maturation protease